MTVDDASAPVFRLTADGDDRAVLFRLLDDLETAGLSARFARPPGAEATKAAQDLVPVLLVAVPALAEARRLVKVLADAWVSRAQRISVTGGGREVVVTNAREGELERVVAAVFDQPAPAPPNREG